MRRFFTLLIYSILLITVGACKKGKKENVNGCMPGVPTIRTIANKQAIVKITATSIEAYLVEEGSIDTKLVPCELPQEFHQNNLQVTISGEVKSAPQLTAHPCCAVNFVITKITK